MNVGTVASEGFSVRLYDHPSPYGYNVPMRDSMRDGRDLVRGRESDAGLNAGAGFSH